MKKSILLLVLSIINLFAINYKKIYINNNIETFLQCPNSKTSNCSNKFFQNNNNTNFDFYMCGKHKRNELRFKDEFFFKKGTIRILKAVFILKKLNNEFTFFQIHTYKGINKPIIRVAVYKNKFRIFVFNGKKYIKTTFFKFKNIKEILGLKFNIELIVKGQKLILILKNKRFHWKYKYLYYIDNIKTPVYFKLGNYLQRNGCSEVEIYNIHYFKQ